MRLFPLFNAFIVSLEVSDVIMHSFFLTFLSMTLGLLPSRVLAESLFLTRVMRSAGMRSLLVRLRLEKFRILGVG